MEKGHLEYKIYVQSRTNIPNENMLKLTTLKPSTNTNGKRV